MEQARHEKPSTHTIPENPGNFAISALTNRYNQLLMLALCLILSACQADPNTTKQQPKSPVAEQKNPQALLDQNRKLSQAELLKLFQNASGQLKLTKNFDFPATFITSNLLITAAQNIQLKNLSQAEFETLQKTISFIHTDSKSGLGFIILKEQQGNNNPSLGLSTETKPGTKIFFLGFDSTNPLLEGELGQKLENGKYAITPPHTPKIGDSVINENGELVGIVTQNNIVTAITKELLDKIKIDGESLSALLPTEPDGFVGETADAPPPLVTIDLPPQEEQPPPEKEDPPKKPRKAKKKHKPPTHHPKKLAQTPPKRPLPQPTRQSFSPEIREAMSGSGKGFQLKKGGARFGIGTGRAMGRIGNGDGDSGYFNGKIREAMSGGGKKQFKFGNRKTRKSALGMGIGEIDTGGPRKHFDLKNLKR